MKPTRLDELRDIILGPDQEKLEELQNRIEDTGVRAADVAEVLPESVATSFRRDSRLIAALRTPLRECVSQSVREDPDEYADALFPVMGPAIRRSVAEALKSWIQQANHVIEQGLSARGLAWRLQAWRAGIPYGEFVLQRTLLYRVDHVYLIHSASGLLIGHVEQGIAAAKDDDAVAAMFTAIQEFVKDSFQHDQTRRLRTAELGDLSLWGVHGPNCSIVAVIRGIPPAALRAELEATLERIETVHGESLRDYDGNRDAMAPVEAELRPCLLISLREPEQPTTKRRISPGLVLLALLGVALLAWLAYGFWLGGKTERLISNLNAAPGIVVTDFERDGRRVIVRGLRDPLAATAQNIAEQSGWTLPVQDELRPYWSMEPEILRRRIAARLRAPDTVTVELRNGIVQLSGEAPQAWIDAARAQLTAVPGVYAVDADAVVLIERRRMQAIAESIRDVTINFPRGQIRVPAAARDTLANIAARIVEYGRLARVLDREPRVTVTGHSDAVGSDTVNAALELARANEVARALRESGVGADWISAVSQLASAQDGPRAAQVTLQLDTGPTSSSFGTRD